MAIADQLLTLKTIQLELRTAIEAKGVAVGDAPFVDYPGFINQIEGGATPTTVFVLDGADRVLSGADTVVATVLI